MHIFWQFVLSSQGSRSATARSFRGSSFICEFPLMLIVIIAVVFPLVDLMALGCSYATAAFIATRAATRAGAAPNFPAALQGMTDESNQIVGGGLGSFLKFRPVGGYSGSGCDLYVVSNNVFTSAETTFRPPNSPLSLQIDTATNIYQFRTDVCFDVGPFVSLAAFPGIKEIQGIGRPARIRFNCRRAVEHVDCLRKVTTGQLDGGVSSVSLAAVTGIDTPGELTETSLSGWNYPQIYQLIKSAGQEVKDEDVLRVYAHNPKWTPVSVNIEPGDKVWIDYRADGLWDTHGGNAEGKTTPNGTRTDANGQSGIIVNGFPSGSVVGRLSDSDQFFFMGNQQWNFLPPGSGQLYLLCNDNDGNVKGPLTADGGPPTAYHTNSGAMTVRVVVAR